MPRNDSVADMVFDDLVSKFRALPWWGGLLFVGVVWLIVSFALPGAFGLLGGDAAAESTRDAATTGAIYRSIGGFLRATRWLVLAILLVMWGLAVARNLGDARRLDSQQNIDTIRALSWQQFEMLLAEWFRRQGYAVEQTPDGPDGGVDLILHKDGRESIVQAKHWKAQRVGVARVRELNGVRAARGADQAILITSGRFTPDARAFAERSGVTLIDGAALTPAILGVRRQREPDTSLSTTQGNAEPGLVAPPPLTSWADSAPPACPHCSSPMVKRTARRGPSPGTAFWGCSNYPRCRGTRAIH